MPSGGWLRDNYDPPGRTFYYLPAPDLLQSPSYAKVLLFRALLDRDANRYPYSTEAHPRGQLFA